MRRVVPWVVGFGLGFAIVMSTVSAFAFAVIGVGGHLLARADYDYARTISFDPSTVAARAPIAAAIAIVLSLVFILVARRPPNEA